jgi:lysophospholipase L1-like esterase
MPRPVWECLLWLAVVSIPWLRLRSPGRRNFATVATFASALCTSACVIVAPDADRLFSGILWSALLGLNLAACILPISLARRLVASARCRPAKAAFSFLAAMLIPPAIAERACRALTELQVLKYHKAIQTVWRPGHDDWRLATITGDEFREPDPVLFWRPVPRKPFNAQRFKGPLAQVPKPPDVVRVMCYGDSLTDGPPKGGWPTHLHRLMTQQPPDPGRRCEVINAGVAGYSSHQGLLRFLQEVDEYDPDLLLVSFGWNDAAEAIGQPDKSYRIPPLPAVWCQRALIRYRAYLVLMYYTNEWRPKPAAAPASRSHPRVSTDDYLANLERFRVESKSRGIPIVFLTRPHKVPPGQLVRDSTWRGAVPRYNAILVEWAKQRHVPFLDVQRAFEQLPPSLFTDECHLSPQGYQRLAKLVHNHILASPDGSLRLAVTE